MIPAMQREDTLIFPQQEDNAANQDLVVADAL